MSEKKKILIIEDDEVVLISLKRLLELSGFQVEGIDETKDCLSKIKLLSPQIILLDLSMPHLGGLEICEMLNNDSATKQIPIIVVSGLIKDEDIKKAYKLGVMAYFTKPYEFPKLLQEINKILAYREGAL